MREAWLLIDYVQDQLRSRKHRSLLPRGELSGGFDTEMSEDSRSKKRLSIRFRELVGTFTVCGSFR